MYEPVSDPVCVLFTQGELSDLGRVLMQGSFSVWISHKKGPTRMKELARFKPMQRHLFLYERALLFCKRREEHGEGADKTPSYSFKHCLKVCVCVKAVLSDTCCLSEWSLVGCLFWFVCQGECVC